MFATSHRPMRTAVVRTKSGCIYRKEPGRGNVRRAEIADSAGWR